MREPPRRQKRMSGWLVAVAVVTGVAAVLHWGPAGLFDGSRTVVSHPAPFLSGTLAKQNPYAANDPWREWLAPETICPGGDDALAPPAAQIQAAVCLLNYARAHQGLPPLPENGILDSAAGLKAKDIVACNDFSHTACGKAADADARGIGLTDSAFGENIFWGPEVFQPPRVAVDQWLNSPHHRENLFNAGWTQQGVAVLLAPGFRGVARGEVWVNEFSAR